VFVSGWNIPDKAMKYKQCQINTENSYALQEASRYSDDVGSDTRPIPQAVRIHEDTKMQATATKTRKAPAPEKNVQSISRTYRGDFVVYAIALTHLTSASAISSNAR
jgi:cell division septation protein DedD